VILHGDFRCGQYRAPVSSISKPFVRLYSGGGTGQGAAGEAEDIV
jgi:hypothetical protein